MTVLALSQYNIMGHIAIDVQHLSHFSFARLECIITLFVHEIKVIIC